uniref:Uncharacterized protein n=1 Tax=Solanum lycopersicum TaxID=4081 RepID=A0A3Q7FC75_SOLLC
MMREISKTLLNLDELLGAKRKKRETCPIRNDLQNNRSAKEKKVVARGSRRRIKFERSISLNPPARPIKELKISTFSSLNGIDDIGLCYLRKGDPFDKEDDNMR